MRKIVYLITQPLDERNYDRFGIQAWIDRGWEVEVWDLTPLVYPRTWRHLLEAGQEFKEFAGYFPITTKNQLECRYSGFKKETYFNDLSGDSYFLIRVKMRLIRMGGKRITFVTTSIPLGDKQKCGFVCKLNKVIKWGFIKSSQLFFDKLLHKLASHFIKPDLVVVTGEKSIPSAGYGQEILKAHNLDYDLYLQLKKQTDTSTTSEYAVFIDQNYCFHPEYISENISPWFTPEEYYPAVCNGLRRISEALGVGLRIAAHPRTPDKQQTIGCFEGIPVEFGRTAELIRDCKVVIGHFSAATQFAVLFGKPVIFLDMGGDKSSFFRQYAEIFATALGKSVIHLDGDLDNVDWQKELFVDLKKYAEYKNKYIKIDGSPEIPSWDIVINYVEASGKQISASTGSDDAHPAV